MPDTDHQLLCLETRRPPAAALLLEGARLGRPEAQALPSVIAGGPLPLSPALMMSPPHSQLLGLSTATMAAVTHFGDHLSVIGHASLERNPYEAMHYWAFYVGISLAGLLSLGAALSTIATVREAHGLMAAGFLCFALSFCVLVQMAFWRFHNPTQVEDAVLDTYDLVYDQAMKSPSSSWWQELATIQDTFLCCGKKSPFGLLASTRAIPCQGQEAIREGGQGPGCKGPLVGEKQGQSRPARGPLVCQKASKYPVGLHMVQPIFTLPKCYPQQKCQHLNVPEVSCHLPISRKGDSVDVRPTAKSLAVPDSLSSPASGD
ncbi:tetraspanin-32 isoform X3 [Peromyscus leucopus]|uniref:tetraspanin-32 isoform X3 n=1 Tax=Peromyscus leucopus TaxID=10041 RepID=UPI001884DA17|nr:tetraspanin-32 isoform X3 [Peromyscus leucopus]